MKQEKSTKIKDILEWGYCIIIALILALVFRYFIGTPTVVQMSSMYPTFKQGDRLILNRISVHLKREFNRGEVITFEAPSSDYKSSAEVNSNNPIAKYEQNVNSIFKKFTYYVLDINKKSYIKRVIGLPGEHIEIRDGNVYINGELLQEEYLREGVTTNSTIFTELTVPDGYIFVMGDNRSDSMDSRNFGCIPVSKVESKVCLRFWPFSKFGTKW